MGKDLPLTLPYIPLSMSKEAGNCPDWQQNYFNILFLVFMLNFSFIPVFTPYLYGCIRENKSAVNQKLAEVEKPSEVRVRADVISKLRYFFK